MVFKRIPILIMLFLFFVFFASCEKEQTMKIIRKVYQTRQLEMAIPWISESLGKAIRDEEKLFKQ